MRLSISLQLRTTITTQQALNILLFLLIVMPNSRGFSSNHSLTRRFEYRPPSWAENAFTNLPKNGRLHLGNFPTPLYKLSPNQMSHKLGSRSVLKRLVKDLNISFYVKRDDMTGGLETGGNKIRKLEFLLADALAEGYKSVITIGGEQSNHCRATAAACRMLGLDPHLILRTSRADDIYQGDNIGYTGNILFDRMVGSSIYCCTAGEYGRIGSDQMVSRLARYLEENDSENRGRPYEIPVGGSNGLGSFGYLNAVDEIILQWNEISEASEKQPLDHVVFACGSGGTACGISLGFALANGALGSQHSISQSQVPMVHAVDVCDSPDYFYNFVANIADEMGLNVPAGTSTESFIRQHMIAHSGKGNGYAISTKEELDFVSDFALETGIVLDPVYSGKAMYHFFTQVLESDPEKFRGSNILFVHTGGALGLFEKGGDLSPKLDQIAPAKRLDIYGKNLLNGVDISKDVSAATR